MKKELKIAPSLLSANFANLSADVMECEAAGADLLHIDVMDGHFVPNITIGPLVVSALKPVTNLPLDCHLMIEHPDQYIPEFSKAGADMISVHVEATAHLHRSISLIKSFNIKAGIALNPVTPIEFAFEAAEYCDFILLMSVNPGFGGQSFISSFLRRCHLLNNFLIENQLTHVEIQVDGGIKADNIADVVRAGANNIVSGSGVFSGNIRDNISALKSHGSS
ncbi:MAG: ribulose-phosphate 3-epimerase [Candidatus Kapabacteria bacterium]|nr:ribulose-phosphate 3-epimerase [Candidatus Kapabacteria bacterium]